MTKVIKIDDIELMLTNVLSAKNLLLEKDKEVLKTITEYYIEKNIPELSTSEFITFKFDKNTYSFVDNHYCVRIESFLISKKDLVTVINFMDIGEKVKAIKAIREKLIVRLINDFEIEKELTKLGEIDEERRKGGFIDNRTEVLRIKFINDNRINRLCYERGLKICKELVESLYDWSMKYSISSLNNGNIVLAK
mgnify:CR=1 FL=1